MVLSGTLKEFILADVFQLLTQQKITGKLSMNDGYSDGVVIFKNGQIVGAEKEDEKFTHKLSNYLLDVKKLPLDDIKGLTDSFDDDLNQLSKTIITKEIMCAKEIHTFAESTIEDITCSLFQWKTGTYQFSSLRSVDSFTVCEVAIPVENIVMEAMRRFDEWNRMIKVVSAEKIFIPTEKTTFTNDQLFDPIKSTDQYLYKKIDGTTPVKDLIQNTCLTEYKVYEALNTLYLSKKITVLSSKLSDSVQAAIHKKELDKAPPSMEVLISLISTSMVILLLILISSVLFKGILFPKTTVDSYICKVDVPIKLAQQNISIASIFYKTQFGKDPLSPDSLKKYAHLSDDDFYFFKLGLKLQYKHTTFEK